MVAHCPEGLGDSDLTSLFTDHPDPEELLSTLSDPCFFRCGQWVAQKWAEILCTTSVIVVSNGRIPQDYFEKTPLMCASSVEKALQHIGPFLKHLSSAIDMRWQNGSIFTETILSAHAGKSSVEKMMWTVKNPGRL